VSPTAVRLLLDAGCAVNAIGIERVFGDPCTPLQLAALAGRKENVALLLERGANPNLGAGRWTNPLIAAIHFVGRSPKDIDMIQSLLSHGADKNTPGALHYAVWQCLDWNLAAAESLCIVKCFLDAGADVDGLNSQGQTALFEAAFHGATKVAALLLQRGASPNVGKSAFEIAVSRKHTEIVKLMLAQSKRSQ
jgi:ankyrin repeat protein